NYVDNYFTNLDVQEEINNKLDEMAENGTLQSLISIYLTKNSIITFNTINDLINNNNLVENSVAQTLGYHSINDGGASLYKIFKGQSENADNGSIINLNNNLYAKLILNSNNNTINVKQFGAYGDNIHDDTQAFKNAN